MKNIFVLLFITFIFNNITTAQADVNEKIEYGAASYYGTQFHGRPTASGEIYNQFALTAAHKTLPLGTVVKVTNTQNKKSVIVTINDRGPFIKGRIIDLSTKAAELLGYRNKGTAYVKVEIVKEVGEPEEINDADEIAEDNGIKDYDSTSKTSVSKNTSWKQIPKTDDTKKPTNTPQPITDLKINNSDGITNRSAYFIITKLDKNNSGFYGLQLGVFSDISVILGMIDELEAKYKQSVAIEEVEINGKKAFKLYVGKFQNRAYADALKLALSNKHKDAFVVKYD